MHVFHEIFNSSRGSNERALDYSLIPVRTFYNKRNPVLSFQSSLREKKMFSTLTKKKKLKCLFIAQ